MTILILNVYIKNIKKKYTIFILKVIKKLKNSYLN